MSSNLFGLCKTIGQAASVLQALDRAADIVRPTHSLGHVSLIAFVPTTRSQPFRGVHYRAGSCKGSGMPAGGVRSELPVIIAD